MGKHLTPFSPRQAAFTMPGKNTMVRSTHRSGPRTLWSMSRSQQKFSSPDSRR